MTFENYKSKFYGGFLTFIFFASKCIFTCSLFILATMTPEKTVRTISIAPYLAVAEINDTTPVKMDKEGVNMKDDSVHFLSNTEDLPDLHAPAVRREPNVLSLQETLVAQAVYNNIQNLKQEEIAEIAG